jgi:hypothetical protein
MSACSASASPSPSGPASEQPEPSLELVVGRVTSDRFGWSAELPAPEWEYRPATEDWPQRTNPLPGAAYTDNFERPGTSLPAFDVNTQQLPADQAHEDFLTDLDAFNEDLGCVVESEEEIAVDGVTGRLQQQTCAQGGENAWEVVVFDGDQVYAIYWVGGFGDAAVDEPVFRGIMESFRFPE